MIDIHSHILPMVDDGAEDMAMALDMARIYLENGINQVIATPHYIEGSLATSMEMNKEMLEELQAQLKKEELNLEIFLGNEAYISPNTLEDVRKNKLASLNNSRYILVELPMNDLPLYVENVIYQLLLEGYIPIIAHPERNLRIVEDPNILYNYVSKGALGQINLPSLEGSYGPKIKDTAKILLQHRLVHFVGTDAHTNRRRSPQVKNAIDKLKLLVGEEEASKLSYHNPKLLLEDKLIPLETAIEYKGPKLGLGLISKIIRRRP